MRYKLSKLIVFSCWICSLASTSAWAQWQLQTTLPGDPALTSVKAVSRDIAWACHRRGIVYRTTDGGKNWEQTLALVTTAERLYCIEALNADTAFVVGGGTGGSGNKASIYRTTNGGADWEIVYSATNPAAFWNAIQFWDNKNGIAYGDPLTTNRRFLIVTTNDGGTTWTPISNPPLANVNEFGLFNCFYFSDKLNGWFGTSGQPGNAGRVFRTTDGGNTWNAFPAGNTSNVNDVTFISPLSGISLADTSPFLTRSVDGGQTWTPVNNLPLNNILFLISATSIVAANLNEMWVMGFTQTRARFMMSSTNGGQTWRQQTLPTLGVGNFIRKMSAVSFGAARDSVRIWAVTIDTTFNSGGRILTYVDRIGVLTGVKEQATLPNEFMLSQNYPNPFNPATTIRYTLPRSGEVTLKIFNLAGQEMATLVNRQQEAGEHSIQWYAEKLPSGVYMYRLQAGRLVETKKMILMR